MSSSENVEPDVIFGLSDDADKGFEPEPTYPGSTAEPTDDRRRMVNDGEFRINKPELLLAVDLSTLAYAKTVDEVKALFDRFHDLVTSDPSHAAANASADSELGKLAVFSGVCEFPMRVKCATLAWHTLRAALDNKEEIATTE